MKHKRSFIGQSLLEFALILPVLLFLVMGFFDLGRAVFYYSSLSNAVREGSRQGVVMQYTGDIPNDLKNTVVSYAFGLKGTDIPLTSADVGVVLLTQEDLEYPDDDPKGPPVKIKISATYCFAPITPGINLIITSTCSDGAKGIILEAESLMWLEPDTIPDLGDE